MAGTINSNRGFVGSLDLRFGVDEQKRTRLVRRYRTGLFHLSKPYVDGKQLVVQVVNPTAGIFEGDCLESRIAAGKDACACVFSPSSTQVYAMPNGGKAHFRQEVSVAPGASLAVMPRWLVPHKGARLEQCTRLDVSRGSRLFYVDLISAGRSGSGEFLQYKELTAAMEIWLGGTIVLKERLSCGANLNRWIWGRGGNQFTYLGAVYLSFPGCAGELENMAREIGDPSQVMGFTPIDPDLAVIRIAGNSSNEISSTIKKISIAAGKWMPVSTVAQRIP